MASFLLGKMKMNAIDLLIKRRSNPHLKAPAPSGDALDTILQAGLRAPDHANLTPWQFIIAKDQGLEKLSNLFVEAISADELDEAKIKKIQHATSRAPMIIIVIARTKEHKKVPIIEQHISAGCAVHAMQMASIALGFQSFWRTGKMAYHPSIRDAFKLSQTDEIVGFLYIGTPDCALSPAPLRNLSEFVTYL